VKYFVGFDLREGGPSLVALLDWLAAWGAQPVTAHLWQFDGAGDDVTRHRQTLAAILERDHTGPPGVDEIIVLAAGNAYWRLHRCAMSTTAATPRTDSAISTPPIGIPIGPDGKPILPPRTSSDRTGPTRPRTQPPP
jgi:hypothetical protein